MQKRIRWLSAALAAAFMGGVLAAPVASGASEEGRRNTTLGLGALSAYLFTRGGSKVPAFAATAATAYAYKQYDDSIKRRHKRERYAANRRYYRSGYGRGYSAAKRRYHRSRRR